ncbi:hypothetical protein H6P81_015425 [Aristolochia fimbriata]|uniref:UspA domain-containing protein n=1 Tax=Aristolochia fimbriata TaxID=158543 RepID=A0AAV7E7M5_ARIFI|nr:hypothetical protein H6P81_015425 [Aristolochia fimbriata]
MVGSGYDMSGSFLRQLSGKDSLNSSKRWNRKKGPESSLRQMEGVNVGEKGMLLRKRVIAVIDQSSSAKHAMMWALTHVANKGDLLTLLQIIPPHKGQQKPLYTESSPHLANSLGSLCKACRPEVEVEALVIQGPKVGTVLSQVKKLEASVLVLGQKKPSPFNCLIRSKSEEFVEQCVNHAECLTMAVRKQTEGLGGYLISTQWQKNFWLLA